MLIANDFIMHKSVGKGTTRVSFRIQFPMVCHWSPMGPFTCGVDMSQNAVENVP